MDFTTAPTLRPRARSARKKISQRAKLEKFVYKKSKNKFPLIFGPSIFVALFIKKKREDWVRNHHTDRRIGNPARAKRARGSFSQRALREKLFDQKEKMTQINCIFPVPQATQHLAYFS